MIILGIETSCDETGVAILELPAKKILFEKISSQVEIHKKTKGIVPEVASRMQAEALPLLIEQAKKIKPLNQVDYFAVANSPGLLGSLLCGVNFAKILGFVYQKPIIPVNHLLAHFYSPLITEPIDKLKFPALGLIVSGGHTLLIYAYAQNHIQVIGETRDDAAGEAFDKTARLLNLGYPGGPAIEKSASKIKKTRSKFTPPMLKTNDFDFSFSGLKTEVLRKVKQINNLTLNLQRELAFAVQKAIITSLIEKTFLAVAKLQPKTFLLGGGVAANSTLRENIRQRIGQLLPKKQILIPEKKYTGDNATIVALAAWFLKNQNQPWYSIKAESENTL